MVPPFSITKVFPITITTPLLVDTIADITVVGGETVVFRPTVTSIHNYEELNYLVTSDLPNQYFPFVDETGIITISTNICNVGETTLTLHIQDKIGLNSVTSTFKLTVTANPTPPLFWMMNDFQQNGVISNGETYPTMVPYSPYTT